MRPGSSGLLRPVGPTSLSVPQALGALLFLLLISPAQARDCVYYDEYIRWIASVDTPGRAFDVDVAGDYAYVADLNTGLRGVLQRTRTGTTRSITQA